MDHMKRAYLISRRVLAFIILGSALGFSRLRAGDLPAIGGFLESATSTNVRALLTADEIQALLPARGTFTFPAPYGTMGVRLTNADDCSGWGDCVQPVGGPRLAHLNNSTGSNYMYAVVGLDARFGGTG